MLPGTSTSAVGVVTVTGPLLLKSVEALGYDTSGTAPSWGAGDIDPLLFFFGSIWELGFGCSSCVQFVNDTLRFSL